MSDRASLPSVSTENRGSRTGETGEPAYTPWDEPVVEAGEEGGILLRASDVLLLCGWGRSFDGDVGGD
jgi:hypothetical protein